MFRQTFEIWGEAIGGEAIRAFDLRARAAPFSIAYFCPKCAQVWARAKVENEPWMVTTVACSGCGKFSAISIPGSLWRALDNDFNSALPRELLLREFDLHLQWYDKYCKQEEPCQPPTLIPTLTEKISSTPEIQAPNLSSGSNPFAGMRRL